MSSAPLPPRSCQFNGCAQPEYRDNKCKLHRLRAVCSVEGCHNQTYARQLCVKHGGKLQCQLDGCVSNARSRGFCCKHGAETVKKVCLVQRCGKYARARGRCVSHGGGRVCSVDSCDLLARAGGVCHRHRALNGPTGVPVDVRGSSSYPMPEHGSVDLAHDLKLMALQGGDAPIDDSASRRLVNLEAGGSPEDRSSFTSEDVDLVEYFMSI